MLIASDSVMSTEIDLLHPFWSVANNSYVPASKLLRSSVLAPLDQSWTHPIQLSIVISIAPSLAPLHETP